MGGGSLCLLQRDQDQVPPDLDHHHAVGGLFLHGDYRLRSPVVRHGGQTPGRSQKNSQKTREDSLNISKTIN